MLLKNATLQSSSNPIRVFASYAHEDRASLDRLRVHLTLLIRQKIIILWTDKEIAMGDDWRKEIRENLQIANVILFLVSADFLHSDFIWDEEMRIALDRHQIGDALVIPILVQHVDWTTAPFAFIQMLPEGPEGCLPVSAWPDPEQAFAQIAQKIRDLITTLDKPAPSVERGDIKGSAIRFATDSRSKSDDFCRSDLLLFPSTAYQPPTMKGAIIPRRGTADSPHFIFNWGDHAEGKRDESERQRLFRYFRACLTVKDCDQWVNLSAYESNRMIPDELVGTLLGHDLLQFDYDLKRLSGTMLHPGFEVGRAYWKALHERLASELYNEQSIHLFQKITLLPTNALIYTPDDRQDPDSVFRSHLDRLGLRERDYICAYVLENELSLLCAADEEALRHDEAIIRTGEIQTATKINNLAVQTLKEIVIPQMEREIRFGASFARVRQMYSAMLLATWVKRMQAEGKIRLPSVDTGSHTSLNMSGSKITRLRDGAYFSSEAEIAGPDIIVDNRDIYAEYLELFKSGLYQTMRHQFDAKTGGFVRRVYSSGAFDNYRAIAPSPNSPHRNSMTDFPSGAGRLEDL